MTCRYRLCYQFVGLIDCYVSMNRVREAVTLTAQAYKQLGTNARTLTVRIYVVYK